MFESRKFLNSGPFMLFLHAVFFSLYVFESLIIYTNFLNELIKAG